MDRLYKSLILFLCSFFLLPCVLAAKQNLTVRLWLFQASLMEGQPELKQVEIMPLSSTPELASLKALVSAPEGEFKAAVINALLEAKNLRSLDDLFLFEQTQREDLRFPGRVVLGRQVAYRIDLAHRVLSRTQAAFQVFISKTKEDAIRPAKDDRTLLRYAWETTQNEEKMDRIVTQELTLGFDDPVVVSIPYQDRPFFMVVKLTTNEPEPRSRRTPTLKAPTAANLVAAPRAVEKILPLYPDELKRRGIKGDVRLRIAIDEKGHVQMVQVLSSLQPYLDYTASQAFWQWTFEPVLRGGKPVRAAFEYTFKFDPQTYSGEALHLIEAPATVDAGARRELERILSGAAEYCRKLNDAATFYTCDETISDVNHFLKPADVLAGLSLRARDHMIPITANAGGEVTGVLVDRPQIMDPRTIERFIYDNDYQMIRRFGAIEERRIVLKENGRRIIDRVELLTDERYRALSPIVSCLKLLDKDHQPLFNYRILKEEKMNGKGARLIEAVPRLGDAEGVRSAKIWIDKTGFQILKSELEGVPLDGYDDVLSDAVLLNIKPVFSQTHEFRVEKNGVMFPDRTTVKIEYPSLAPNSRETKSKIELSYKNFKFFTVETTGEVKK